MADISAGEMVKRILSFPPKTLVTIGIISVISIALASNGSISVISTNRVSAAVNQYRWEPSSADTGGWTMSWHDIGTSRGTFPQDGVKAYTSVWNGSWAVPFEHRANGNPMLDQLPYIGTPCMSAGVTQRSITALKSAHGIQSITHGQPTEVLGLGLHFVPLLRPKTSVRRGSQRTFT